MRIRKVICKSSAAWLVALLAIAVTGCARMSSTVPVRPVPLEELKTKATYDIIGEATGTSTAAYLFGCIPVARERKSGSLGGLTLLARSRVAPVVRAALYNAIEGVPGADALIAPRWRIVSTNYIVYREQTATVKGKAIRYNVSSE